MDFAKRLKELRVSRGLTQDDLARELKLVKSSIGMYENGKRKPSFEVLEAIADYFNVNMDTLYSSAPVFVPSLKRVPMLGYAAAGQPLENLDGQDTYYVETDSRYAVDFCITVQVIYFTSNKNKAPRYEGSLLFIAYSNRRPCVQRLSYRIRQSLELRSWSFLLPCLLRVDSDTLPCTFLLFLRIPFPSLIQSCLLLLRMSWSSSPLSVQVFRLLTVPPIQAVYGVRSPSPEVSASVCGALRRLRLV